MYYCFNVNSLNIFQTFKYIKKCFNPTLLMWTFHLKNSSKFTPEYLTEDVLLINGQMKLFSSLLHEDVCNICIN